MASLASATAALSLRNSGGVRMSALRSTGAGGANFRAARVFTARPASRVHDVARRTNQSSNATTNAIVDRSSATGEDLETATRAISHKEFEKNNAKNVLDVLDVLDVVDVVDVLSVGVHSKLRNVSAQKNHGLVPTAHGGKTTFRQAGLTGGLLGCDRDVRSSALPGSLQRLDKSNKYPVLFFAPEMRDLAKKIVDEDVGGSGIELGDIDWRKFPDGFPDLFVNDAYGVRDRHVAFLASFHSPEVIFEQISIIYSLPKMFVASFTLILPFFPTGTSELVEREGEIATAVTLARILSHVPPSRGGPCSTLIFDIHALQERFYFGDNILPCFESGIPLLLNRLARCPDAENIVIAYPDEGARKRFHAFFKGMEEVVCTKVRDGGKRLVKLKEGEPAGRHVVIVDDLVQSGGTLIECQKLLAKLGASKVSAYVTHGVFPGNSWERFTSSGAGGQGFTKFFLTDSCPITAKAVAGVEPFEILSLARPIAEALHV